jgi:predicted transcriptional regulator
MRYFYYKYLENLSKREIELMRICWKKKKLSVNEVIELSPLEQKRHYQTVKTQLDTLVMKGYLKREKHEFTWLYSPKVSSVDVFKGVLDYFIDILTDNFIPSFINFVEAKKISPEEMEKLRKLVENIKVENIEDKDIKDK